MKKILPVFGLILPFLLNAQNPQSTTPNFYDIQKEFYKEHPEALPWNRDALEEIDADDPYAQIEEKYEDGEIEKFKRWETFMEPRVYPSGNFLDPGILMREYYKYKQAHPSTVRTANWQLIGPDIKPEGVPLNGVGRINAIAINPLDTNIIFVGVPCGGLWKTTDGGTTWSTSNSDLLPSISIGDIAINPIHTDTMYAATGDSYGNEYYGQGTGDFWGGTYSAGLMMSTNAGATWSTTGLSYEQTDAQLIYRVVVNPASPSILFAATRGGLYRSADAGSTWTEVVDGYFFDVEFNTNNPDSVYAVDDSHFFRSDDGGVNWFQNSTPLQSSNPGDRISIAVTPNDPNYIYAWTQSGYFSKSTNAGVSFVNYASPNDYAFSQGVYDVVLAVSPTDKKTVVAGGVNLARTTDGGSTWEVIGGGYSNGPDKIHPDFHAAVYYPNDGSRLIVGNDGGIFKSTDGSYPWTDVSNGMAIKQYYRMANSVVDHDYILAGAQDNGTDKFNGTEWTHVFGADGMQPLVDYENDRINFAASQGGNITRSIDGCASFGNANPSDPSGQYLYFGHWTTPYVLDPSNHHIIYYGGAAYDPNNNVFYGTILKSTDDGLTWSQIMSGDVGASDVFYRVRVAPSNPDYIYGSTINQMFFTSDGGNTWTETTSGLPSPVGGITDISISEDNPLKIWITFSGYEDGEKVYSSDDGGLTWDNISGTLPNIPVSCITHQRNADDILYIGTDFGVFYRDNNMSDWETFNDGLPNVMVTQLDILYSFNKLRAATYGRSIWESDLAVSAVTANDAGLLAVISPAGSSCEINEELVTRMKNFGTTDLTSATIHYSIDGGLEQTYSWSGNLAPGDTQTVDLGSVAFGDGSHEMTLYTSDPNGVADENTDNDKRSGFYTVTISQTTLPIVEGFENNFPPDQWHLINNMWAAATVGGFNLSENSMYAPFYNVTAGRSSMVTPRFEIPTVDPPALLTFDHAYAPYPDPIYNDTLQVVVTTDCFNTSEVLYFKTTDELQTASATYNFYVPNFANEWVKDTVDLSSYIGMTDVQVAFEARSGYGNNLYVDDINLDLTPLLAFALPMFGEVTVFPNPSTDYVTVMNASDEKIHSIEIMNALGERMMETNESISFGSSYKFDLSTMAKGVYFVHAITDKGTITRKIVIQ